MFRSRPTWRRSPRRWPFRRRRLRWRPRQSSRPRCRFLLSRPRQLRAPTRCQRHSHACPSTASCAASATAAARHVTADTRDDSHFANSTPSLRAAEFPSQEDAENEYLLTCAECHQRHHAICYGFTGKGDARLPRRFVCCRCTAAGGDSVDLDAFAELALWRRCLYDAIHSGTVWSDSELAKRTGMQRIRIASLPGLCPAADRAGFFAHMRTAKSKGIALFTARRMNVRLQTEGIVQRVEGRGGRRRDQMEVASSAATELIFNAYFNGRLVATKPSPAQLSAKAGSTAAPAVAAAAANPLVADTAAAAADVPPQTRACSRGNPDAAEEPEQLVPSTLTDTVARMSLDAPAQRGRRRGSVLCPRRHDAVHG